ncbi:DUF3179 domain-containing protein [Halostella sp. PRR32]|uniref:DUF3179 domain-containing protein n=1 Tax=Halostella sp. PRR32 TaxID=3098147 RepID=UPI002B1E0C42|nr:DUF3179 domain-containing protein [Halostella sp. PRR32]
MRSHGTRRAFLAATAVVGTAGCLDAVNQLTGGDRGGDGTPPPFADRALPVEYEPTALAENVVSGGVSKDGIPSVDEPRFEDADAADGRLIDRDVVFGIARGGEARAYPQYILVYHEIVNDEVGGDPVSVTYCPLTGTAQGFERGETTFGVSGDLLNSNLVMYDRGTDSRWPQMLATAVEGPLAGETLRELPVAWTTWEQWRAAYPETAVLTEDTGHVRDYGMDPYGSYNPKSGYYTGDGTMFEPLSGDDRLGDKAVVVGGRTTDGVAAFEKDALRESGIAAAAAGDARFLAVHDPSLDVGYVYRNPEAASFRAENSDIVGPDGDAHPPSDLPLDRVLSYDAMWFAWAGFYPSTTLHD